MDYFEEQIVRYERRIKKIKEHPDPKKLKSNVLLYECEMELRKAQLKAWQEGTPLGSAPPRMQPLLRSLGMQHMDTETAAQRTGQTDSLFDIVRQTGMTDEGCDMTIVPLAMCISKQIPPADYIIGSYALCFPFFTSYYQISRYFDVPFYALDIPSEENEENLHYVTTQLHELIEDVERKVPGAKYDEDKLIELQEKNRMGFDYYRDIFELLKTSPCPQAGKDSFAQSRLPSLSPNPDKFLEYLKSRRDELGERVAKGIGAVAEEKLRIVWSVTGPFLYYDPFDFLEARGVSIPFLVMGARNYANPGSSGSSGDAYYGDQKQYGRKLSPLEEEARANMGNVWACKGPKWVEENASVCRDLHADGLVHFMQWGCTPTLGIGRMLKERLEQDEGMPVLLLEGRQLQGGAMDIKRYEEKLEQFIVECLARKQNKAE